MNYTPSSGMADSVLDGSLLGSAQEGAITSQASHAAGMGAPSSSAMGVTPGANYFGGSLGEQLDRMGNSSIAHRPTPVMQSWTPADALSSHGEQRARSRSPRRHT